MSYLLCKDLIALVIIVTHCVICVQVHLDSTGPKTPDQKEVDFFAEHEDLEVGDSGGGGEMTSGASLAPMSQPVPIANGSTNGRSTQPEGTGDTALIA